MTATPRNSSRRASTAARGWTAARVSEAAATRVSTTNTTPVNHRSRATVNHTRNATMVTTDAKSTD
ncbi:hypothetical protein ACFSX1_19975 [Micromonospora eburnea]